MRSEVNEKMIQRVPSIQLEKKLTCTQKTCINDHEVIASYSTTTQSDLDLDDHDILDLDRIADRFHEKRKKLSTKGTEVGKVLHMEKVDFEKLKENDRLLKRSYDLLFKRGLKKYPHIVKMTLDMIERLERRPHLYCPYERVETTRVHVSRWLNNHTNNPVAELCGFTSIEPYEPKRFIPTVSPRVSNSDISMVLGKRKRSDDPEVEGGQVNKSSSDIRLVCDDWYRPRKCRRQN